MKKLSIAILILAFMASCSNKENGNTKNRNNTSNQTAAYMKLQNPQGPTVALNLTDFKIENEFIYYQGNIFTGKVTFNLPHKSGYFFVSNGKLEGETEINYKLSGTKKVQVYEQGKLVKLTQTENNIITEVIYSDDPNSISNRKIVQITTKYDKNSYSMDLQSMIGSIQKNGKFIKDLNVEENKNGDEKYVGAVFEENGGIYKTYYNFTRDGAISEIKYKLDSKNQKSETLSEIRKLNDINTVLENGLTLFRRILSSSGESATPEQSSAQPNGENISNPTPTQTNQNEDDLALLDRVYDEVMHKNNPDILKTFSKRQLAYIRNTLFAKKGYIFTKPEYSNYFSQKSWYRGTQTNQDTLLNEEEKRFIDIFRRYEN